jgi:hypothetical protein
MHKNMNEKNDTMQGVLAKTQLYDFLSTVICCNFCILCGSLAFRKSLVMLQKTYLNSHGFPAVWIVTVLSIQISL